MGIHLADQTLIFLQSVAIGAVLGLLYDVFRISRIAIPTKPSIIFVEDVLYFALCAVITFFLMMSVIDGQLRYFLLIGELIGAVVYFFTLGQLVMRVSKAIINGIKAVIRFFGRYFFTPVWRLLYWIVSFLLKPVYFLTGIAKKNLQRMNFRLKVGRIVLYNHCKDYLLAKKQGRRKAGETKANGDTQAGEGAQDEIA